jgi:hypothetical protein
MSGICYLHAQDTLLERNTLKAGAWAMQFGISNNFTLTSFQGSTFSIKYQLSDMAAIRGGISISTSSNNGNGTSFGTADSSFGSLPTNNSSSSQGISFNLQYLWYMNPSGPIHFFIGFGPSVSYSNSQNNSAIANLGYSQNNNIVVYYLYNETQSSSTTQWGAGVTGSVGVEWFLSQWFSLRAEYGESLQYRWGSNSSTTNYFSAYVGYVGSQFKNSGTTNGWTLSSSSVSFGLNIYW